jgi:hypothetical protein
MGQRERNPIKMFSRDRVVMGWLGAVVALVALCLGVSGCAARQAIPVKVFPKGSQIYVDGDRGHVVMVREPGYRTQQVILESVQDGAARQLRPARIAVRLAPESQTGKAVQVDLETGASKEGPVADLSEPRNVDHPGEGRSEPGSQEAGGAGGREEE